MFIAWSMPHLNIRLCGVHHRWHKRIISTKLNIRMVLKQLVRLGHIFEHVTMLTITKLMKYMELLVANHSPTCCCFRSNG